MTNGSAKLNRHLPLLSASVFRVLKFLTINEAKNSFVLHEGKIQAVLDKVPEGMKICVVSVVGAFRTGKSFVLDFFLRYLHSDGGEDDDWLTGSGCLEGNENKLAEGDSLASESAKVKSRGFGWRAGHERNTTGIWVWSKPFFRKVPSTGEDVAVLLMDTQGMFDGTLSQQLTASIFGLSTLFSSYQIYNIQNRIQEDNLQHLALFTEYGRVALSNEESATEEAKRGGEGKQGGDGAGSSSSSSSSGGGGGGGGADDLRVPTAAEAEARATAAMEGPKAFQRLDFLVRDWQDIEDDSTVDGARPQMEKYLQEILAEKQHEDLQSVREHISMCFETVDCFLMPHPGFAVTNKSFNGQISKIRPVFRTFLRHYVENLFNDELVPKKFHGQCVTGPELLVFVKEYVKIFQDVEVFPEAKTLLGATCEANNRNAKDAAFDNYKREMDKRFGPDRDHVPEPRLMKHHAVCRDAALTKFWQIATIGALAERKAFLRKLDGDISGLLRSYLDLNRARDPWKNLEPFLIPLTVAFAAYLSRIVVSLFCFAPQTPEFDWELLDMCPQVASFLSNIYIVVFSLIFFILIATGHQAVGKIKGTFKLAMQLATGVHEKED